MKFTDNNRDKMWITKGIKISSNTLKNLYSDLKYNPSVERKNNYRNYKRIYFKVIRQAKSKYFTDILTNSTNKGKDAWKLIKYSSTIKQKKSNTIIQIEDNGTKIQNEHLISSSFNDHFSKVGLKLSESITEPPLEAASQRRIQAEFPLILTDVTPEEVTLAAKRLKNKTSFGLDGVSNKLIKSCIQHISLPLARIATDSFNQGMFPNSLKQVTVTPIFKGGDSNKVDSYRPITKVSSFSKILELLFLNRLKPFLEINQILTFRQFGFVEGKSTNEAMSCFISSIVEGIEKKKRTVGVMMDLSKAFDCVSHTQLLDCLRQIGLNGNALHWLSSYLSLREQCVEINGKRSNWAQISYGVPQGSILGPMLYNIYINNLVIDVPHQDMFLYADDIVLTFNSATLEDLEKNSYITLTQIHQFLNNLNLHLNLKKTVFMEFSRIVREEDESPTINIALTEIEQKNTSKYLGIIIDDDLSWEPHINEVCHKLASTVFLLGQLAKYRCINLLKLVYHSLFESRLRYGLLVWGSATDNLLKRVFMLQKRAIRVLAGLRRRDSCRNSFKELQLLTFPSLYIYEVIMHARFSSCGAQDGTAVHDHNTRARVDLRQNRHRTALAAGLPVNSGAKFFSKLPLTLKNTESKTMFKRNLKNFLVAGEFYSEGEFLTS